MPALSNHGSLSRQWELLRRLPAKAPGKTVLELRHELAAVGFVVEKRTVQRDLDDLSRIFPLRCNNRGIPHGWHWMEGKQLELPAIDISEAQTLLLVKDLLKPMVPRALWDSLDKRFAAATRKLDALAKDNAMARWPNKVRAVPNSLPLLAPHVDPAVLSVVQEALLKELQCEVAYQNFGAEIANQQTLHPLALLQRGLVTYLVATAFDYEDPRLYVLHRIKKAALTDAPLNKPAHFDLDTYIATGAPLFGSGEPILLEAKVSDGLAKVLSETPLSLDMNLERQTDDWWAMTASTQDTWQLRWWLLSQGSDIVVLKPKPLRRDLMNELKASLENYRDRSLSR